MSKKIKLVPAAFNPKQADIKEISNNSSEDGLESGDASTREREYAGRIENASERFHTPVNDLGEFADDYGTEEEEVEKEEDAEEEATAKKHHEKSA